MTFHDKATREGFWRVPREGVYVGSIVYDSTRPEPVWGWWITVQDPAPGSARTGMAGTREAALRDFRSAWDRYREWHGEARNERRTPARFGARIELPACRPAARLFPSRRPDAAKAQRHA